MRLTALLALLASASRLAASTNSWSVASPDQNCAISVTLGPQGRLTYGVKRAGKPVILDSPLGLLRDDQSFERDFVFDRAGEVANRREVYDLFTGPRAHVEATVNHRLLQFRSRGGAAMVIELAASDEGVAFRYTFPETNAIPRSVHAELTGFHVPIGARGWLQPYHVAGEYTPAYEDFYFRVAPGQKPPESRAKPVGWCFPALFEMREAGAWVLITESGSEGQYCGCHLGPDSTGGLYQVAFAAANEETRRRPNRLGPEPRSSLPWVMPWRVFVLGQTAGQIATSTLVTDLAPACRIAHTSWIRAGRVSWAWWSNPDGPATAELFNRFSDFGEEMGWEYTLFDAGWWKPGLAPIAAHAREKKILPLAWMHARDFYEGETRRRKLDAAAAEGVHGVKVDFWCSDRQEALAAMQALFEDAATRRMIVNLHGCTIPRGWQRTWPNFLTCEAVLGTESYIFESRYTKKAAQFNTVVPFTRNAIGPMDGTPVACSSSKYRRTTTAAHELATSIVWTSGLIHFADTPEFFRSLPEEARRLLRDAPARWHETQCLLGDPGRVCVFARRAGHTWFIAGLNGTDMPLPMNLDMSRFREFQKRILLHEGNDPAMQVAVSGVDATTNWRHQMPPRGGFILRLE